MCGIAGMLRIAGRSIDSDLLVCMADRIAHRGPDGAGTWLSPDGSVGLAHRRLSIIDLSESGRQPMVSASGRFVISFNGEIYNFQALRKELEKGAERFRGHSDTEVALAAIERWGLMRALERFTGMFAFALWDCAERSLQLVRDRIGIKPLYFIEKDGELIFGSELRPIQAALRTPPQISVEALTGLLSYGYVPGPHSIFRDIRKLAPGTILTKTQNRESRVARYWDPHAMATAALRSPNSVPEKEQEVELESILRQAVRSHMVADVPIGVFLSGGVDSSIVAALMQTESSRPVKSFSIGFDDSAYDEATHAALVARHIGTEHCELYCTDAEALRIIPELPSIYDEPFADCSQIPTYLLSHLTRQHVTVSLSGDGGDELFGGYNRYVFVNNFWRKIQTLPRSLRRVIGGAVLRTKPETWDRWLGHLARTLPRLTMPAFPGQKLHKVATVLAADSIESLHQRIVSFWSAPEQLLGPDAVPRIDATYGLGAEFPPLNAAPPVARQMYWDLRTYLVDDILTKVDRASMHVGLEARVPLLDHAVVEHAWRIPVSLKLRGNEGKWILKRVLARYVPARLVDRSKMGFGVPIDAWLRGPLRDWAASLLETRRIESEGFLNGPLVGRIWQRHVSGQVNYGAAIWAIVMFQAWLEKQNR